MKKPEPSRGDDFLRGFDSPNAGALVMIIFARKRSSPRDPGSPCFQHDLRRPITSEMQSI